MKFECNTDVERWNYRLFFKIDTKKLSVVHKATAELHDYSPPMFIDKCTFRYRKYFQSHLPTLPKIYWNCDVWKNDIRVRIKTKKCEDRWMCDNIFASSSAVY